MIKEFVRPRVKSLIMVMIQDSGNEKNRLYLDILTRLEFAEEHSEYLIFYTDFCFHISMLPDFLNLFQLTPEQFFNSTNFQPSDARYRNHPGFKNKLENLQRAYIEGQNFKILERLC